MKPLISHLSGIAIFIFFPVLLFWRKGKKIVIVISILCSLTLASCFQHYFRSGTQTKVDASTVQMMMSLNKIFIIHFKNQLVQLKNITVTKDKLEADMTKVQPEHLLYTHPSTTRTN